MTMNMKYGGYALDFNFRSNIDMPVSFITAYIIPERFSLQRALLTMKVICMGVYYSVC
jgi:hypothetical protein